MWGRLLLTGAVAASLHAGIGAGARAVALKVERPLVLETRLLDKALLEQIRERIKKLQEEQEVAIELEQLDEAIAQLEREEGEPPLEVAPADEGAMGTPDAAPASARYAVKGPADNPDPHLARQATLAEIADLGMIGLLNSGAGGDPDAPTAPWGHDDSLGTDHVSARGNMWGDDIGDAFGAGGLGLEGIGEGGGGRGEGIGLGNVGVIGHGAGTGTGQGFGSGHGRLGRAHKGGPPKVRMGATEVAGRLPPEVIQRIVRANFARLRACYTTALADKPGLSGRASVSFTILESGAVSKVSATGSGLPESMLACLKRAFASLSFPEPEGGIVKVTYPVTFSDESGGSSPAAESEPARKTIRARTSGVSVDGQLKSSKVKKRLKEKERAFAACGTSGTVRLSFTIGETGQVILGKREDAVLSEPSDRAIADCALGVLGGMTFPAPKSGSATVRFQIAFGD